MSEEDPTISDELQDQQQQETPLQTNEDGVGSQPQLDEAALAKQALEEAEAEAAAADAAAIAAIPVNPLTLDLTSKSLSLIGRTANGLSFAYTRLEIHGKGITSLDGLDKFPHLRYVDVATNALLNIDSLSTIEYLLSLDVHENQLRTIPSSLDRKKYLQHANFAKNHLKEFKITSWPLLTWLNLNGNRLKDLVLDGFPELLHLEARDNRLIDIGKWNCNKLQRLFLAGNELQKITNLEKKQDLQLLHLRNNKITSLSGFSEANSSLTYINLRGNQVSNLEEVEKLRVLPNLKILVLSDNPIDQMEGYRLEIIARFPKLERLDKEPISPEEREEANAILSVEHPDEEAIQA